MTGKLQVDEELWAFLKENRNNPEIDAVCVGPLSFLKNKLLILNDIVHLEGRSFSMSDFKTTMKTSPWTLFPTEFESISYAINLIVSTENGKVTLKNNKSMTVLDFVDFAQKKPWRIVPEEYEVKCWNQVCPSFVQLEGNFLKDGVSVECPDCKAMTIVGPPGEGLRWVYFGPCFHFAEAPLAEKPRKCGFCKKPAGCNETENFRIPRKIGVPEEETEVKKRKMSDGEVKVDESEWRKNPEDYEIDCENEKCSTTSFSISSLRPDGISAACPDCGWFAPIKEPKSGFEFMQSHRCNHFYEVPKTFPPSKPDKCGFCGDAGVVFDNLASWIRLPRRK